MSEWQPIESAPRNGTRFLARVFDPDTHIVKAVESYWCGRTASFMAEDCENYRISRWVPLPPPPE
jgi:hypothetical protein